MKLRLLKGAAARTSESILTVGIVLVFFMMFQALLSLSFPQGLSLKDLMTSRPQLAGSSSARVKQLVATEDGGAGIATLEELERRVKHKPFGALTWGDTEPGMPLARQHAVQTFERSAATIAFDEGSELELGERSLVVLRDVNTDRETSRRRASVVVLDGELRGRIRGTGKGKGKESIEIEVESGGGSTKLAATSDDEAPTTFRVALEEDGTSTVSVFEGSAEVTSGGETVVVKSNEVVTISEAEAPSIPEPLPNPPVLAAPADGAVYTFRSQPPRIEFSWEEQDGADEYTFVLSKDPEFEETVFEGRLSETQLTHGNLDEGTYYWRMSGSRGDLNGGPSAVRSLRLVKDASAPPLSVKIPEVVTAETLVIRGTVDAGTRVFISDEEVRVDASGAFEHTLHLQRGLNLVVVEAIDSVGNTSYESHFVRARY